MVLYIPQLVDDIPEIIKAIVETLVAGTGDIIGAALSLIIALGTGLIEAIPTLVLDLPEIILAICDGLLEGLEDIAEVGLHMVEGLWEGIKSGAEWIKDKVTGFADDIYDSLLDFYGIASPSKLLAEVGDYMVQGLGKGWEDNIGDVMDEINDDLDVEGNVTMNASVGNTEGITADVGEGGLSLAGAGGDLVIPVYIGQTRLDEIIITNEQMRNYRSGGR